MSNQRAGDSINFDNLSDVFRQRGREAGTASNGDPLTLTSSLDEIYAIFLRESQLDSIGIRNRISKLEEEIVQLRNSKRELSGDIESNTILLENKENRIQELQIEKIRIKKEGAPGGDIIPAVIGAFIAILLTLYLFVFYSSTGYSSFYGIKKIENAGVFNPETFSEAANKGGGVLAAIILFPVIFLGLGFLIHDALDKKKYGMISLMLIFTFITDAIMGYKISENLHNIKFNKGQTDLQWNFSMIFTEINFYLILMLGFVVYVIWGFLLHYTLEKFKELQPDEALSLMLNNIQNRIDPLNTEVLDFRTRITRIKSDIEGIENSIEQKSKDIIGYRNGVIHVNIPQLQSLVGQFMQGWFGFINFMFPNDSQRINILTTQSSSVQDIWIQNIITNLEPQSR